jgi:hypothetical protein
VAYSLELIHSVLKTSSCLHQASYKALACRVQGGTV